MILYDTFWGRLSYFVKINNFINIFTATSDILCQLFFWNCQKWQAIFGWNCLSFCWKPKSSTCYSHKFLNRYPQIFLTTISKEEFQWKETHFILKKFVTIDFSGLFTKYMDFCLFFVELRLKNKGKYNALNNVVEVWNSAQRNFNKYIRR